MPTSPAGVSTVNFDTHVEGVQVEYPQIDFANIDVNPDEPTEAKPGSEEKVVMLAARYNAGLPLWHNEDCVDHGPGQLDDEDD